MRSKARRPSFFNLASGLMVAFGSLVVLALVLKVISKSASFDISSQSASNYNPQVNPADFSTNITNKYFTLKPGMKVVYEAETVDGLEKIEITVTGETKMVMGVDTLVYFDKVWLAGVLVEDTKDYLAQNKDGDVWYFGEEVDNYENGVLVNHDGAWLAGVDGAKPGIWMRANLQVGESYLQEYYAGVAEDTADVVSVSETVTVPFGTFTNCVKTHDWTPLDSESKEHKYYCPGVATQVLAEHLVKNERLELVSVQMNGVPTVMATPSIKPGSGNNTDDDEDEDEDGVGDKDDEDEATRSGKKIVEYGTKSATSRYNREDRSMMSRFKNFFNGFRGGWDRR